MVRLAIALHLFRGYCNRRDLHHPEINRFVDHFWAFIAISPGGDAFESWVKNEPPLTHAGLGDDFPPGFDSVLMADGVAATEFRQVLSCTTEVLYSSMYGAANEESSRRFLSGLASIAESVGVEWPDTSHFSGSKWSDRHGWGEYPSEQELVEWRRAGRG